MNETSAGWKRQEVAGDSDSKCWDADDDIKQSGKQKRGDGSKNVMDKSVDKLLLENTQKTVTCITCSHATV